MAATGAARSIIRYRARQASRIPAPIGVYALCDLDEVPIYVGKSVDGIRARVRRHITSARSDIIANRQIDVWEVAYVWCWELADEGKLPALEGHLFHRFHAASPLMNGQIPKRVKKLGFKEPDKVVVQLLPDDEIKNRRRPENRLPRQAKHFGDLLDHYLNVKDTRELRLALVAHFSRLQAYFEHLRSAGT